MNLSHAIILAGGRGTRLGSVSTSIPKVLLPIAGTSLLNRHCEFFHMLGVSHIQLVVSNHYRAAFSNLTLPPKLELSFEDNAQGPLVALMQAASSLTAPTYILMGDVYFSSEPKFDIVRLSVETPILLGLSDGPIENISDNCAIQTLADGMATHIVDKPKPGTIRADTRAWNGWMALHPSFYSRLKVLNLCHYLEGFQHIGDFFEIIRQHGVPIAVNSMPGRFVNINTPKDLAYAEALARAP